MGIDRISGSVFSIIVPAYNVAAWLRECLDSVWGQAFTEWECIVVDDESSDESGSIADEYAARDSRFRVIHQKNAGEGGARNAGLAVARGEWILFLDGDDVLLKGALGALTKACNADCDLVRFGFCEFDDGDVPEVGESDSCFVSRRVDISSEILMPDFFTYVWQHAYRRSVVQGIRFKRYKRGCDRVYVDDVLLNRVNTVKVVDAIVYGYRRRAGSAMNAVPFAQVLRDEMDHRLDIMEMIDASPKKVAYAGDRWLEGYFTSRFHHIVNSRGVDRREVVLDWRKRMQRLRRVKGLSHYGRFVAWTCPLIRLRAWDALVCYIVPRWREGGSPIRWLKRKACGRG